VKLDAAAITVGAGGRLILDQADISLSSGEFVGLVGPNGAGKSTLLRALLGLAARRAGAVLLDGQDIGALPARERARRIAFLPQDRRVEWRLSGYDVVMLGRYPHRKGLSGPTADDRQALARALAAVEGEDLIRRPVSVLSGGELTRILLARALAVEAPLLIADEPIAALDPYHQLQVMEILRARARSGAGVLAVIHDLSLAMRFMDRLVLMQSGRVIASGAPRDVLSADQLARVYGVRGLEGVHEGVPFLLPWSRV